MYGESMHVSCMGRQSGGHRYRNHCTYGSSGVFVLCTRESFDEKVKLTWMQPLMVQLYAEKSTNKDAWRSRISEKESLWEIMVGRG